MGASGWGQVWLRFSLQCFFLFAGFHFSWRKKKAGGEGDVEGEGKGSGGGGTKKNQITTTSNNKKLPSWLWVLFGTAVS